MGLINMGTWLTKNGCEGIQIVSILVHLHMFLFCTVMNTYNTMFVLYIGVTLVCSLKVRIRPVCFACCKNPAFRWPGSHATPGRKKSVQPSLLRTTRILFIAALCGVSVWVRQPMTEKFEHVSSWTLQKDSSIHAHIYSKTCTLQYVKFTIESLCQNIVISIRQENFLLPTRYCAKDRSTQMYLVLHA